MEIIKTHEAKTHLSRYLAQVEAGEQFIIARGGKPVAMLVPMGRARPAARPKVGDIEGEPFEFPLSAFAPLTDSELKEWGL